MRPRRRGQKSESSGTTALAEPRAVPTLEELRARIRALTDANRSHQRPEIERELLALRHGAGIRILDTAPEHPEFAAPDAPGLPSAQGLAEHFPEQLTPGLLRAAILRDGCALVRRMIEPACATRFAEGIERAYRERERVQAGSPGSDGYYEEFEPDPRFGSVMWRPWIKEGGGLLAADSPRLSFEMMELFEAAGMPELISGYLGEPAVMSIHKTTLRKAEPAVSGAWHQDGAFMGPVRALNAWVSLSHCGDRAPGLDILPRRLHSYVATGTEGAALTWTISEREVQAAAAERPVVRPVFEPGDALLFDELFLHKTGSDPSMSRPRFAIESWFFGGSAFPGDYAPLAL